MYLSFVTSALQEKANGRTERFNELVDQFNAKNVCSTPPAQLRSFIQMLSHVVSRLERTHSSLVEALVRMPWTILDSTIVKSYTVLIGMLLSARPEYLSLVLGMISQGFTFQSSIEPPDAIEPSTSSVPITRGLVYDRLHYLLRHLLTLVPTLPSTLMPLLSRNFPHKRQNVAAQSTYIRNLLRVSGYCPELSDKILSTIVDRAVQIDVEIQVELEELEDEAAQTEEVFEIDPFDTLIGQEEDSDSDDSDFEGDNFSDISSDVDLDDTGRPEAVFTNVRHIQAMVKKLDTILTLTFDHFNRIVPSIHKISSSTPSPTTSSSPLPELP
ncbi:RNA polymerase I-specific transcription initiation factor RRN3, partial [Hymenopellis radicata]